MSAGRSLNNSLAEVADPPTSTVSTNIAPIATMPATTANNNNNNGSITRSHAASTNTSHVVVSNHEWVDELLFPAWHADIAELLPRPPTTKKDGGKQPVITCLDFGIHREIRDKKYPNSFFCSACIAFVDDYGVASAGRRNGMLPNGSRYKCTAKHPSFEEPASNKVHSSLLGYESESSDDDASREF